MANYLLDALTDFARSQNPNAPAVKYGYASEIFPGLLSDPEEAQATPSVHKNMGPPQPHAAKPATHRPQPGPLHSSAENAPFPLDWQARAQGVTVPYQNPVNPEVATKRTFHPDMGPPAPLGLLAGGQTVNPPLGPMYNAPDTFSAQDLLSSVKSGVGQGVAKTLGLPGEVHNQAKRLPFAPQQSMYDGLMNKYGPLFGLNHLPDQAEMMQIAQQKYPQLAYQPQTRTGQVAQAAGRYLPGMLGRGAGQVATGLKNVAGIYPWMLGATTTMGDERNRNQGPVTNGNVTGGYF